MSANLMSMLNQTDVDLMGDEYDEDNPFIEDEEQ